MLNIYFSVSVVESVPSEIFFIYRFRALTSLYFSCFTYICHYKYLMALEIFKC